jgi:hypothetical protein
LYRNERFDLAGFGEIIYNPPNTPAVGVNFILAPNMEDFHVRTAEMTVPASQFALLSARAFARQFMAIRRNGVTFCPSP